MPNLVGRRKSLPIDLFVWRLRENIELHHARRRHMFGQALSNVLTQLDCADRLSIARRNISDKSNIPRSIFASDDDRLSHEGMLVQYSFDFTQLDPMPANLDLMIHAAEKLDTSVRQIANQVARTIDSRIRFGEERIRKKPFRGEFLAIQIASSDTSSADQQFPRYPHWLRSQ